MEFNDVIRKRTATRKFSDKKVSQEDIIKILEAENLEPTAKNFQSHSYMFFFWRKLKKIDEIILCCYNAPCYLLVCSDKSKAFRKDEYSTFEIDASIVATHMILEATNLNIDSTWIEAFNKNEVKNVFSLSGDREPVCIINLGYKTDDCQENPLHNQRKDIKEIVKYI